MRKLEIFRAKVKTKLIDDAGDESLIPQGSLLMLSDLQIKCEPFTSFLIS